MTYERVSLTFVLIKVFIQVGKFINLSYLMMDLNQKITSNSYKI